MHACRVYNVGFATLNKKMKEYVKCNTDEKGDWIFNNHVSKLDIEHQKKFYNGYANFLHAPAFIVVPSAR